MPIHDAPTSEPSIPGFIEWCSRKDPNERYNWQSSTICACGQYYTHLTGKVDGAWHGLPGTLTNEVYSKLNNLARGSDQPIAPHEEWTFGKLLSRVKERYEV